MWQNNCNHCKFKKELSRYFDLEDYCYLNQKKISQIVVDEDCPMVGLGSMGKEKLREQVISMEESWREYICQ